MSKIAQVSLDDLPNEVIVRILLYSDFKSIVCYATTGRRGYNLVKSSANLQLQIELEVAGLEIVESASDTTTPRLLQDLKRYRDAWVDMKFGPATELPMPKDRILLWELREGSFISAYSTIHGRKLADAIQVIPLDSQELPKPIKFDFTFHEFTIDLSQKLVVLAVVDSHPQDHVQVLFRSSETGLSHPLAQQPLILVLLGFPILHKETSSITLEIMGDILVAKFADIKSLSYEILIWNWKTTSLLNRISSRTGVCDLGFLDRQNLIMYHAAPSDGSTALRAVSLRVYQNFLSPSENRTTHHNTYTFVSNDYSSLDYTFSFVFPEIHPSVSILPPALALRSDPIPGRLVHNTGSAKLASIRSGVLGLIFPLSYNANLQPQDVTYRIFVSTSRLFDLMNNYPTKTFEWNMWGEYTTRWFTDDKQQADWISWVSGSRYLRSSPGVSYGSLTLSIIDFCPFSVKRHSEPHPNQITPPTQPLKGRNANMEQRWARTLRDWWNSPDWSSSDDRVVVDIVGSNIPTIVEVGFQHPVISRLGWRSVTMARPVPVKVWLIDGEHLVGKDFRGFGARANQMTVCKLQA